MQTVQEVQMDVQHLTLRTLAESRKPSIHKRKGNSPVLPFLVFLLENGSENH